MDCLRIGRAKQNDTRGAIVNYANAIGLYSFDTEPVHNKFISSVLEKVGNIGIQSRNYVTALDALGKLLSNLQIAGNKDAQSETNYCLAKIEMAANDRGRQESTCRLASR